MFKLRFSVVLVLLLVVIGCQGSYYKTLPPELVPIAKYDEALTTLVAVKKSFNAAVSAEGNPAVKKQMLDIGYDLFKRADGALAVWKTATDIDKDPAAEIRAYQAAWLELSNALLQMGIVEVK